MLLAVKFIKNRLHFIGVVLLVIATNASANTDIWLFDLDKNGEVLKATAKNITNRIGYDNQPSFSQDNRGLYYTKMLSLKNKGDKDKSQSIQQQADIFYYDFETGSHTNITRSLQSSEYSPTESPLEPNQLLTVKVEPDGTQRLWTVNTETGQQQMFHRHIKPVGYFAWGKHQDLLLFVLDEPMKLKYASHYTHKNALTVDGHIGRSLRYNSGKDWFSYSKGNAEQQTLWKYDQNFSQKTELFDLPKRSQYYTWLNSDTVISAAGAELKTRSLESDAAWQTFSDLKDICPLEISRIAVNENQSKIALVCDEVSQ